MNLVTDFQKGDLVQYCGIFGEVVENYGTSGLVDVRGEGRIQWRWTFAGTDVILVARAAQPTEKA